MKTVLLIDDDASFVTSIKDSLDKSQYSFVSAKDGTEGMAKIEESKPDLILLDILMPNMDGMEFLKRVNEKYGEAQIPILITSNSSSLDKISEGVALGIRGYFVKSDESLKSISEIINKIFAH